MKEENKTKLFQGINDKQFILLSLIKIFHYSMKVAVRIIQNLT